MIIIVVDHQDITLRTTVSRGAYCMRCDFQTVKMCNLRGCIYACDIGCASVVRNTEWST